MTDSSNDNDRFALELAKMQTDQEAAHRLNLARVELATSLKKIEADSRLAILQENSKNRRLALVLAFILILAAMSAVLFAPAGREVLSYWIGLALLVFSAGAAGYGSFWAKAPGVSIQAGDTTSSPKQDKPSPPD